MPPILVEDEIRNKSTEKVDFENILITYKPGWHIEMQPAPLSSDANVFQLGTYKL